MSHDGGKTYWLVGDNAPADGITPTYVSEPAVILNHGAAT
jgi:hypothetical protein